MKLDSIREIKSHFLAPASTFAVGVATPERSFPRSVALGITNGPFGPQLAVRCYGGKRAQRVQNAFLQLLNKFAKNETQIEFLEMPSAIDPMASGKEKYANQGKCRPLKMGWSVGHQITAGSIGCITERKGHKGALILNAHVLNNCNEGKKNDPCYQPGVHDGGTEKDTVARVFESIKLQKKGNVVDAAVAQVIDDMKCDPFDLGKLGKWKGFSEDDLEVGQEISKLGRTTEYTRGKITAIEVDNLTVNYGAMGVLSFNGQIEMVAHEGPSPGSGSMTINSDNRGIGLNFAGNNVQGYSNDMREVVKALKLKAIK